MKNFIERIRGDSTTLGGEPEEALQKSLLIFSSFLIGFASMLWWAIRWVSAYPLPILWPLIFWLLLFGNLQLYLKFQNFGRFRCMQLALFLIIPFMLQGQSGNFISAGGVSLWALLAPTLSVFLMGTRRALFWFLAYIVLTLVFAGYHYFFPGITDLERYNQGLPRETVFTFVLNFIFVSSLVFFFLRHAELERAKQRAHAEEARQALLKEQTRSERLLLNVLPAPIAERLKRQDETIADGFCSVSVLFADIVNFTAFAEGRDPREVFAMLNLIFSSFDRIIEKYGLEKIKTIGDAYMAAGGLSLEPTHHGESTIVATVHAAMEMQAWVDSAPELLPHALHLRMGIATGPVVAGVVGRKKFIYDLWGDTVNLASRITAEGSSRHVQVDEQTYFAAARDFDFYPADIFRLKGKGNVLVYCVKGSKH